MVTGNVILLPLGSQQTLHGHGGVAKREMLLQLPGMRRDRSYIHVSAGDEDRLRAQLPRQVTHEIDPARWFGVRIGALIGGTVDGMKTGLVTNAVNTAGFDS